MQEKKFTCDRCDHSYHKKGHLREHYASKGYKSGVLQNCELCSFKACTFSVMLLHKKRVHGIEKGAKNVKNEISDQSIPSENETSTEPSEEPIVR